MAFYNMAIDVNAFYKSLAHNLFGRNKELQVHININMEGPEHAFHIKQTCHISGGILNIYIIFLYT